MSAQKESLWFVRLIPLVASIPLFLGHCSGGSSNVAIDAGGDGSLVNGNGAASSSGSVGGADASRGGSSGATGSGGSNSGGSSGSGNGSSGARSDGGSGGSSDGGGASSHDAGTLCTSGPGIPPSPQGCMQCLSDTNCPTTASHCLNGACVTCTANSDCGSGSTPVCWPGSHSCHAACGEGGATCPTGMGQPNHCDPSTGACVGCLATTDCPTTAPICDPTTKQCVQCQMDSNCSGSTPHCDTTTQACVGCVSNSDCTNAATPVCRTMTMFTGPGMPPTTTRACQPGCTSSSQCTDAGTTVCDSNGNCVQCVDNSTCSAPTPICETTAGPFGNPMYETCVVCVPPPFGSDAGSQGCDGGTCMYTGGPGPNAGLRCQ